MIRRPSLNSIKKSLSDSERNERTQYNLDGKGFVSFLKHSKSESFKNQSLCRSSGSAISSFRLPIIIDSGFFRKHFALQLRLQQGSHTLFPLHRTVSQLNFLYHIAFCRFCQEKSARECYFKAMSCQSSFCPCSAESALTSSSVRYSGDILCISAFTSGCVKGRWASILKICSEH